MNETQKLSPSPFQLVCVEAAEVASFWPEVRQEDSLGPPNALSVLALWAHFRRFPEQDVQERTGINCLVEQDAQQLLQQFFKIPPLGDWRRQTFWLDEARHLDESWNHEHSRREIYDLEYACYDLFSKLDRYDLAVYAANKLLPANHELREKLQEWQKGLKEAEDFLREHLDLFYSSAALIMAYRSAYRPDLDDFDENLWLTTCKHYATEEEREKLT
jgi:hypothetical protein